MERWRQVDYSQNDIEAMRRDALKRVNLMQQQAQRHLNESNRNTRPESSNRPTTREAFETVINPAQIETVTVPPEPVTPPPVPPVSAQPQPSSVTQLPINTEVHTNQPTSQTSPPESTPSVVVEPPIPNTQTNQVDNQTNIPNMPTNSMTNQPNIPNIPTNSMANQPNIPDIPNNPIANQPNMPNMPTNSMTNQPNIPNNPMPHQMNVQSGNRSQPTIPQPPVSQSPLMGQSPIQGSTQSTNPISQPANLSAFQASNSHSTREAEVVNPEVIPPPFFAHTARDTSIPGPRNVVTMPPDGDPPQFNKTTRSLKETALGFGDSISETVSGTIESITSPITQIMDIVGIDNDKLLIIGLLIVLLNEKSDKTLLLALGYLLFT